MGATPFRVVEGDGATSDVALVESLRRGDRGAELTAWNRFSPSVDRTLRRLLGPGHEQEDLLQEVFLRFFRRVPALREPAAVRAFLTGIAIHVVRAEIARKTRFRWLRLTATGDLPEPAARPDDPDAREAVLRYYRLLDEVGGKDRSLFVARTIEGLTLGRGGGVAWNLDFHGATKIEPRRETNCPAGSERPRPQPVRHGGGRVNRGMDGGPNRSGGRDLDPGERPALGDAVAGSPALGRRRGGTWPDAGGLAPVTGAPIAHPHRRSSAPPGRCQLGDGRAGPCRWAANRARPAAGHLRGRCRRGRAGRLHPWGGGGGQQRAVLRWDPDRPGPRRAAVRVGAWGRWGATAGGGWRGPLRGGAPPACRMDRRGGSIRRLRDGHVFRRSMVGHRRNGRGPLAFGIGARGRSVLARAGHAASRAAADGASRSRRAANRRVARADGARCQGSAGGRRPRPDRRCTGSDRNRPVRGRTARRAGAGAPRCAPGRAARRGCGCALCGSCSRAARGHCGGAGRRDRRRARDGCARALPR